ncbi:MAG TPA: DUF2127 domain-containing protein [Bryobacteraceae bacterium]|nr:DUF2127 domain-containing protein [Bryobacteraceae bacterium]
MHEHHHHHAAPTAIDERTSATGLHAVAIFESVKGISVLLLGLGVLAYLHKDLEEEAQNILTFLHINPEHRLAHAFLRAAAKTTDARLWGIAAGAVAYATVRFTEAWGLWKRRVWAEWFALLSGALYLPWEIVKVAEKPNWLHLGIFTTNMIVLLYMLYIRVAATRAD